MRWWTRLHAAVGGSEGVIVLSVWVVPWALVLTAWVFLHWGPVWHRSAFDQGSPLRPTEWAKEGTDALFVPALVGVVGFVFLRVAPGRRIPLWYFTLALLSGGVGWSLMYFALGLEHLDCTNSCVPVVPSYAAIDVFNRVTAWLCLLPATLGLISAFGVRVLALVRRCSGR